VDDNWAATAASIDETRAQLQTAIDQTTSEMQTSIDETDAQLSDARDRAESQIQRTINVSIVTIGLFAVAGVVVAAVVFIVSRQIVRPVQQMSDVAEAIENEEYHTAEVLDPIARREDEIGQLARVFRRMASEVFARMERLKQQVVQLQIVIDQKKMEQQVAEITESDYFQDLQSKVKQIRERDRSQRSSALPSGEGD
jgi:nitrate/nitrite-specific signal transduction histidine kinase